MNTVTVLPRGVLALTLAASLALACAPLQFTPPDAALDAATPSDGTLPMDTAMEARVDVPVTLDTGAMDVGTDAPTDVPVDVGTDLGCPAGQSVCSGACTSLTTTHNCGSCGTACAPANATGTCATGTCAIANCATGYLDCNGTASDGCEVDGRTTVSHCGTCGVTCATPGVGTVSTSCSSGSCHPMCASTWGDCDGDPSNGCEANLVTTTLSCGACNQACGTAHAMTTTCSGGTCHPTCMMNYGHCTTGTTGCETPLNTGTNCGACGTVCPTGQACLPPPMGTMGAFSCILCGGRNQACCMGTCNSPYVCNSGTCT